MDIINSLRNTNRLSKKLLFSVLLFSGVFSTTATLFQLHSSYQSGLLQQKKNAYTAIDIYEEQIARLLWSPRTDLVDDFGKRLFKTNYFSYTRIVDRVGQEVFIASDKDNNEFPVTALENSGVMRKNLSFRIADLVEETGYIEYQVNQKELKNRVWDEAILIFGMQLLKAVCVSIFFIMMFNRAVLVQLMQISNWLKSYEPERPFMPLVKTSEKNVNELTQLKNNINALGLSVHKHTVKLEELVIARTAELELANKKLEKLAFTDSLTGISNRAAFFKQMNNEVTRATRLSYSLGLLMLDLDHFKSINDTYGHDAGDKVLIKVAEALTSCIRQEDTLGRMGGEEFAIIVPGADRIGMQKLATRITETVKQIETSFIDRDKQITISIGYTRILTNESFTDALKRADENLYKAKSNGRNCYVTDFDFLPTTPVL